MYRQTICKVKKMTKESTVRKNKLQKYEFNLVLTLYYCWTCNLPFSVVCMPSDILLERTDNVFASIYQLGTASRFKRGGLCLFPLSALHHIWHRPVLCMVPHSLWVHRCIMFCCIWEASFLCCFLSLLALTLFLPLFPGFSEPWGQGPDEDTPLRTRSLTFCT